MLGCACEQLWRAIERDNALAKIEQPDVQFMQETAKRLFKAGRLTKTDRKAIAERIDEAIADHRANRGAGPEPSTRIGPALGPRYQVVELKRPYGRNAAQGRNAVIASVIAWATQAKIRNDDGTFSDAPLFPEFAHKPPPARYVRTCWELFRSFNSK